MIIQISSGQGPAECELAVGKFYDVLKKEYPDIKVNYFLICPGLVAATLP